MPVTTKEISTCGVKDVVEVISSHTENSIQALNRMKARRHHDSTQHSFSGNRLGRD